MAKNCYMDIQISDGSGGRLNFLLNHAEAPMTADNFYSLCVGDKGLDNTGKNLHYLNSSFHRIVDGFMCQGGDYQKGDGTGGASIYGPAFADENLTVKHTKKGILGMANSGPDTNGSQFYITFEKLKHLDGKH